MTETGNSGSTSTEIGPDGALLVSGDIDMASGPLVEAAAAECDGSDPLVLDLGAVTFIDSSGLRSLLAVSRRAEERGSRAIVRNVGPAVERLMEITGTARIFGLDVEP